MDVLAARLDSFNVSHVGKKKRASDSKGGKALKWPHKSPAPARLAEAGFFFAPTPSAPDNTTCFICEANIDGWETQDDPLQEHIKFAPQCGWAINRCIEQTEAAEGLKAQDPMSETMIEARRMTFRNKWPHESKRGWVCKTQRMIDAGWYFSPTAESDDYAKCAYCCLSLDGWEPKDDPYAEHQRRSPDCAFFAPAVPTTKAKGGKSKRPSKASSRLSSQSNITRLSEASSANWEVFGDDSVMTIENEAIPPPPMTNPVMKGGRPKRASKASKQALKVDSDAIAAPNSFIEPEDDDYEVKVPLPPAKKARGRKRKSDEIDESVVVPQAMSLATEATEPPLKRRNTQSRDSVLRQITNSPVAASIAEDSEIQMADADVMPPPPLPKSRKGAKGAKGAKKRTSSRTRQASTTSTASMASLRAAVPDDNAIEAALEADLNRPVSDDGGEIDMDDALKAPKRRLTKTRPVSKQATTSTASIRGVSEADVAPENIIDRVSIQGDEHSAGDVKPKRRVVSRQKVPAPQPAPVEPAATEASEGLEEPMPKKRGPRGRKAPQKGPARKKQDEEAAPDESEGGQQEVPESSAIEQYSPHADLEHETDASLVQGQSNRAPPKRGRVSKKTKAGQEGEQLVVQHRLNERPSTHGAHSKQTADEPIVEDVAPVKIDKPQPITKKPAKTTQKSKKGIQNKTESPKAATPPPTLPSSSPLQVVPEPEHEDVAMQPDAPTPAVQATPTKAVPTPSGHSPASDVENQPPSSRPASVRPPLQTLTPSKFSPIRVPLAPSTPVASPSRSHISKLHTTLPWTAVDLDTFFLTSPDKENSLSVAEGIPFAIPQAPQGDLPSPEKEMTVEEWITANAKKMEEKLREDCERLVGKFEGEGMRALKTLEGVVCRS